MCVPQGLQKTSLINMQKELPKLKFLLDTSQKKGYSYPLVHVYAFTGTNLYYKTLLKDFSMVRCQHFAEHPFCVTLVET